MPFKVHTKHNQKSAGWFTPTERLFLTRDGRLVTEDDPAAAWLFCIPGRDIPMEDALKYGLVVEESAPELEAPTAKPEDAKQEPEVKESQPAETKVRTPKETKVKKPKA